MINTVVGDNLITEKKAKTYKILRFFVPMGILQISQGQIAKGMQYLLILAGYIAYMVVRGARDFVGFFTLKVGYNPATFSMVYGLIAILITATMLFVAYLNIKSVGSNVELLLSGKRPQGFKKDILDALNHKLYTVLLAVPVLGVLFFTVLPLMFMILISFTNYESEHLIDFTWQFGYGFKSLFLVGDNIKTLGSVLVWTLVWAGLATVSCYFGGLFLAMLINKKIVKAKTLWRTLFMITMATPQFISLLIMRNMFAKYGPINTLLLDFGWITERIEFWKDVNLARSLVILVNFWVGVPYLMIMMGGILINIPEELYEAARIEGASKLRVFLSITMPYMLFITTPLLVTQFVGNINNFNVIFLLTGGEPTGVGLTNAGGTDILITWLYKLTKTHQDYALSSAIGLIIFALSAFFSLIVYRRTASYKGEGDFSI